MKIDNDLIGYNLITNGPAVKTGRKIDGKDEWVKNVNLGQLPNTSSTFPETGIPNTYNIIKFEAVAKNPTPVVVNIPHVDVNTLTGNIRLSLSNEGINNTYRFLLETGTNRTSFIGVATVYYTEN